MALATITDIKVYIDLPNNAREDDINNRIREAERFDLRPQIGKEFLEDLQQNPGTGSNATAIDELKPALCYYAFARHILNAQNHPTQTGFVKKETPYSNPVSLKELQAKASDNRAIAFGYLEDFIDYIEKNRQSFPLYNGKGNYSKVGSKIAQSKKT